MTLLAAHHSKSIIYRWPDIFPRKQSWFSSFAACVMTLQEQMTFFSFLFTSLVLTWPKHVAPPMRLPQCFVQLLVFLFHLHKQLTLQRLYSKILKKNCLCRPWIPTILCSRAFSKTLNIQNLFTDAPHGLRNDQIWKLLQLNTINENPLRATGSPWGVQCACWPSDTWTGNEVALYVPIGCRQKPSSWNQHRVNPERYQHRWTHPSPPL